MKHGLLILVLLLPTTLVVAKDTARYAPLPEALKAVPVAAEDQALLDAAMSDLRAGKAMADARRMLILLGDAGLRRAAERLAEADVSPQEKTALLIVVAAAEHAAADTLLSAAAREPGPLDRMIAAHGLGRVRSPAAIAPLAALARDPLPAVRIAALRSLFAFESAEAVAARLAVPPDPVPELLERRLRWHRRAHEGHAALLAAARTAYLTSPIPSLRLTAAHYLSVPALHAPLDLLESVLRETGGGPLAAGFFRMGRGLPQRGYDRIEERRIAIDTFFALLERTDATPAQRTAWIRLAVAWVANPISMDPYSKETIPETALRRRLPDLGETIVAPLTAMLREGAFDEPRQGMILLRELGADIAMPLLRDFLTPRTEAPVFESRAEAQRRRFVRGAAAGALQEIGRIEDGDLARALLLGDEPMALKVDIVGALEHDRGAWVVPLLVELLNDKRHGLRTDAILALEERPEPAARAALVEDLFARIERPSDRLRPLVRPGDEAALAVMTRALGHERTFLRRAALQQFNRKRNPALCRTGGKVLAAHEPDFASQHEIQAYLTALLNVAPSRAVAYVAKHWDRFPEDSVRWLALRLLADATGTQAREAAIRLALERVPVDAPRTATLAAATVFGGTTGRYAWDYRVEEVGARLRAMLQSEDVILQREALKAWMHAKAPDAHKRLLALLDLALAGKAYPERDSTYGGEQAFAQEVIGALTHQPWAKVEPTLLTIALEIKNDPHTRLVAAQRLIGRIQSPAREALATWLGYIGSDHEAAPGRTAYFELQLFLGAAVGLGASEKLAAALQAALVRDLWAYLDADRLKQVQFEGPAVLYDAAHSNRVRALARAVGSTKHEPSILAMLSAVFDARLAGYARVCVERQADVAHAAGPGAAAIRPSPLHVLGHNEEGNANWGMPSVIYHVLGEAGVLADAPLAAGLEAILMRARRDGRLARFPALYLVRVLQTVLNPLTGRKARTAEVIWRHAQGLGTSDGPMQFFLHSQHVSELADNGRFAEAARAQRHLVRILVRGNHEDHSPGIWALNRAVQDALEGAAAFAAGQTTDAERGFARALTRAPHDPNALNAIAWYRALARYALDIAETEALRATRLESRVERRPSANAADTLAYILLLRGRPDEGLEVLLPRMREKTAVQNGPLHYHLAQMYAASGRLRSARDALLKALTWDRALARNVEADSFLKPLLEKLSFEAIQALAAKQRFEEQLP